MLIQLDFILIGKCITTLLSGILLTRFIAIKKWRKFKENSRLKGKTFVITGGNCGIGKAIVEEIVLNGGNVVMACRDEALCLKVIHHIKKKAKSPNDLGAILFKYMDLKSFKSVESAAKDIIKSVPQINVLINNAAIMRSPFYVTEDGFESHMSVNHLSHALFTDLLMPTLLKNSSFNEPNRVVFVTSSLYTKGVIREKDFKVNGVTKQDFDIKRAYSNSKLAALIYAKELSKRIKDKSLPLVINMASPGMAFTKLNRHFKMPLWKMILFAPLAAIFIKTPKEACQTILHCAASEKTKDSNGVYFRDMKIKKLNELVMNSELSSKIYEMTKYAIKQDLTN